MTKATRYLAVTVLRLAVTALHSLRAYQNQISLMRWMMAGFALRGALEGAEQTFSRCCQFVGTLGGRSE